MMAQRLRNRLVDRDIVTVEEIFRLQDMERMKADETRFLK
jgi:hypothetical protein